MYFMKVIIETFEVKGRKFTICYDNGMYVAIEDCYITNGMVNQTLNGLQTCANDELRLTLEQVKAKVEMQYYIEHGMTTSQAFCEVWNIPLTREIEEAFCNIIKTKTKIQQFS